MILAVLSMALGNLVAIAQTNIKRMLAYSTISHVGFIFLGLLAGSDKGYAAAMFYAIVYALTAAGIRRYRDAQPQGLRCREYPRPPRGLNDRSPWLAFMMLLILFSMAGVPPTVGFFAKLFVLDAVISIDMVGWPVSRCFSIIGAFCYIRVVKVMYFDKPIDSSPLVASMDTRDDVRQWIGRAGAGLFPAALLGVCGAAFGA